MTEKKLVSIILPAYNAENTIGQAIDSILSQTYKNLELIIINDGSKDSTVQEILKFKDERIKFFSRENRGLGNTLNEMIDIAKGDLIARMDADDISYPDRISKQVKVFLENESIVMVGGQIDFLVNNKTFSRIDMPLDHKNIRAELLKGRFPICHPAIMFKKSAAIKVGCYRLGGAGEDLDFFLRMSEVGLIQNIEDKVLNYRMEFNSLSTSKRDDLNKGYAFAIYNANKRREKLAEVDMIFFEEEIWKRKNIIKSIACYFHNISEKFYRKFYYDKSCGNEILALMDLLIVCLLRPRAFFLRIRKMFNF